MCVGGDRTSGYTHAKEQLFRTLDDINPDPRLAELEASIMSTVNKLEIGTMGFGGKVTLIGCKIGALNRLPASFFVSVAYDCWAFRRLGVELNASTGAIDSWLYRDPSHPIIPMLDQAGFTRTGREVALKAPLSDEQIRALKVGDVVMVSGRMFTGRDAVHSHLMKHEPPVDLRGSVLYHCGPVVVKEGEGWRITAAGPTTSIREEPYQGEIIKRYGVRAVIGKGGMGAKTLAALKEHGAVYLNAIGGAAQFYARSIKKVDDVSLLEFGTPEAMWHLTVEDFPAIVTMDAHGNSLHKDIEQESGKHLGWVGLKRRRAREGLGSLSPRFNPEPLNVRSAGRRETVLHGGNVEVHRLQVGDGEQRTATAREVHHFQVSGCRRRTVRRAGLFVPHWGGRDERLARFLAVDTRIRRQFPRRGAERAAQGAVAVDDLRQRGPRSARRAVAVVPMREGVDERRVGGRGEEGPLKRAYPPG